MHVTGTRCSMTAAPGTCQSAGLCRVTPCLVSTWRGCSGGTARSPGGQTTASTRQMPGQPHDTVFTRLTQHSRFSYPDDVPGQLPAPPQPWPHAYGAQGHGKLRNSLSNPKASLVYFVVRDSVVTNSQNRLKTEYQIYSVFKKCLNTEYIQFLKMIEYGIPNSTNRMLTIRINTIWKLKIQQIRILNTTK